MSRFAWRRECALTTVFGRRWRMVHFGSFRWRIIDICSRFRQRPVRNHLDLCKNKKKKQAKPPLFSILFSVCRSCGVVGAARDASGRATSHEVEVVLPNAHQRAREKKWPHVYTIEGKVLLYVPRISYFPILQANRCSEGLVYTAVYGGA